MTHDLSASPQSNSALAWTSFGLGVGGLIVSLIPFLGIISWGLSIAAIIVGVIALKRGSSPRWASIAGLSAAGATVIVNVISAVAFIALIIGLTSFLGSVGWGQMS